MKTNLLKLFCVIIGIATTISCEKETMSESEAVENIPKNEIKAVHAKTINGNSVIDFNNWGNGAYTRTQANNDFGNAKSINDNELSRLKIKDGTLSVKLLKNATGSNGGQYAKIDIEKSSKSYTLTYKVKFPENFEWSKGGKIPGLGGGKVYSGCKGSQTRSNGDGWSSRIMWTGGRDNKPYFYPYIYYNGMSGRCGNSFSKRVYIKKNKWYTIKMFVEMNSGSNSNGVLNIAVNGETLINKTDMKWATKDFGKEINTLMFSVYRGGNKPEWYTSKDTEILFDEFNLIKG